MKKLTLKNALLTILQLPVAAILLLATSMQLVLTKCLARIDNPLSSPFTDLARRKVACMTKTDQRDRGGVERAPGLKVRAAEPYARREVDLKKFDNMMSWLKTYDREKVNSFRETIEATMIGRVVAKNSQNRRLYAVLVPTKEENLRRIEKVFNVLPRVNFTVWLVEIEVVLGLHLV